VFSSWRFWLTHRLGHPAEGRCEPTLPSQWKEGQDTEVDPIVVRWKNRALASLAVASVVKKQLGLLSQGKRARPGTSPLMALIGNQLKSRRQAKRYRRWIGQA
jgi:hypothetical protein